MVFGGYLFANPEELNHRRAGYFLVLKSVVRFRQGAVF